MPECAIATLKYFCFCTLPRPLMSQPCEGRFFVALGLTEAEHLRGALHGPQKDGQMPRFKVFAGQRKGWHRALPQFRVVCFSCRASRRRAVRLLVSTFLRLEAQGFRALEVLMILMINADYSDPAELW